MAWFRGDIRTKARIFTPLCHGHREVKNLVLRNKFGKHFTSILAIFSIHFFFLLIIPLRATEAMSKTLSVESEKALSMITAELDSAVSTTPRSQTLRCHFDWFGDFNHQEISSKHWTFFSWKKQCVKFRERV